MLDEDVGEGRENADLGRVRRRVIHAVLDRAEGGGRANVPADLVESLDDARADHVVRVGLEVLPCGELARDAGGGKLLEDHRAIGCVAGVLARPEGGGRGDGLQVAQVRGEGGLDRQDFRAVLDADVDVDAVQEHLMSPVGGALDQLRVALRIGDALAAGACEGVRAGGRQVDAQVRGQRSQVVHAIHEVGHALGDGRAWLGDDLDRVEQHLAVHARVELAVGRRAVDDGVRALTQVVGITVNELELPLDTNRGALGGTEGQRHVDPFAGCLHSGRQGPSGGRELPYRFLANRRQMIAR